LYDSYRTPKYIENQQVEEELILFIKFSEHELNQLKLLSKVKIILITDKNTNSKLRNACRIINKMLSIECICPLNSWPKNPKEFER